MIFSDWIKNRLEQKRLRASQLAHYSGISESEISRLLMGKRNPSLKTLKKIAPILKVSMTEIIRAAGYLPPDTEKPKIFDIPLLGSLPSQEVQYTYVKTHPKEFISISYNMTETRPSFALKVRGNSFESFNILENDILVISTNVDPNDNDLIIVKETSQYDLVKYYRNKKDEVIIQMPDSKVAPKILNLKKDPLEIIGKVILVIKKY